MKFKLVEELNEDVISDRYKDANKLKEPDKTLAKWCIKPDNRNDLKRVWPLAIKKYSNIEPAILYRGMNFYNKDVYDKFMQDIKDNKITFNNITSWSHNENEAKAFAKARCTYFGMSDMGVYLSDEEMRRKGERIHNYRGIILKTSIQSNVGIDLNRFEYHIEDEVLLPAGTYEVSITEELTYKDMLGDNYEDIILNKLDNLDGKELSNRLNYILKNADPDSLSDEAKHKLFLLTNDISDISNYKVWLQDRRFAPGYNSQDVIVNVGMGLNETLLQYYTEEDKQKIYNAYGKVIKKILKEIEQKYPYDDMNAIIEWPRKPSIDILKKCGVYGDYLAVMNKTLGQAYYKHNANSQNIKTEDDIKQEVERLKRLFNSMN